MNELASLRLPVHGSEKKQLSKFGYQGQSRILPNPDFFLAEVLHIRGIFSSYLAVLQISRTSQCLLTQRLKKFWIFIFLLYNASQYSVRKIWFTIQCYQSTIGCCFCCFVYWYYFLLAYRSKAGSHFVVVQCFYPRWIAGG